MLSIDNIIQMSPTMIFSNKKDAINYLAEIDNSGEKCFKKGIIIQVEYNKFYVFEEDPDLRQFQGMTMVNEVYEKRIRYPVIDIDSKIPSMVDLLSYFGQHTYDITKINICRTTKGYHILLKHKWITYEEHKELLKKVAEDNPTWNVDKIAGLKQIKVIGTKSDKENSKCKKLIFPEQGNVNEILCCPVEIQQMEKIIEDNYTGEYISNDDISEEDLKRISIALTGADNNLIRESGRCKNMISYNRVPGSFCFICERRHGYDYINKCVESSCIDASIIVCDDCFKVGCHSGDGKGKRITICRNETLDEMRQCDTNIFDEDAEIKLKYEKYLRSFNYRSRKFGGEFPRKQAEYNYWAEPYYVGGEGCKIIEVVDYLDGSPCGIGKSIAAMRSIRDGQSLLYLSYRKSFTDKTKADYNLECYRDIAGEIVYRPGDTRRIITQIESIVRVSGIPDVIIIDEWHGIRRQMINSKKNKLIWEKLTGLVSSAKRVIVLDALANNDDLELFRKFMNRPEMKFINNEYQIDMGKKFIFERSHEENLNKLLLMLQEGKRVVVFTHNKRYGKYSVEELAKLLQRIGYRVKYYHAETNTEEKFRDFSNPDEAFADIDVVINNHTLEAGVSIVNEQFQHLFCFSEELGSVEATKQALHRFRCVREIHYSVASKNYNKVPLTRDEIRNTIEERERNCTKEELHFRCPNFNELNTGFGYMFISEVIEENNSKCYFTGRLVKMMESSGYEITCELPDEFEEWKKSQIKKKEQISDDDRAIENANVDEFLQSSVGERIASASNNNNIDENQGEENQINQLRYYHYNDDVQVEPYKKKLLYLNKTFQCDVSKLPHEQIEHLNKNVARLQKYYYVVADKLNDGRVIEHQPFRSDKISLREQLEIVRDVLDELQLPDVVPMFVPGITELQLYKWKACVRHSTLVENIKKMMLNPEKLEKYMKLIKYSADIFPGVYFRKGKLTIKNIIEKIKLIYKEFGCRLESDDNKNVSRYGYTLYYAEFPRSDFMDNEEWINTNIDDIGIAGKDVLAVDEHTKLLKFFVWNINNWFYKYYSSD